MITQSVQTRTLNPTLSYLRNTKIQNIFDGYEIMNGIQYHMVRNLSNYGKIRKGCRCKARVMMLVICPATESFEQTEGFS